MDHASLLLEEATRLLATGNSSSAAAATAAAGTSSSSSSSPSSILLRGSSSQQQQQLPSALRSDHLSLMMMMMTNTNADNTASSPSPMSVLSSSPSAKIGGVVGAQKNKDPINSLSIAMLHDLQATRELIELNAALKQRELNKLKEASQFLEEEKRVRANYVKSLQTQMDSLQFQKRKLLAPLIAQEQEQFGSGNNNQQQNDFEDQASTASGGEHRRLNLQEQQQQAQFKELYAHHQLGQSSRAKVQQVSNNNNNNNNNSSAMSLSQKDSVAPSRVSFGARSGGSSSGSPENDGRHTVERLDRARQGNTAEIPGVSFGVLTTSAAASRYARHWSDVSHS